MKKSRPKPSKVPERNGGQVDGAGRVIGYLNRRIPNNWGRWGDEDERGTANFILPQMIARAAGLVRSGRVISCAVVLDEATPVPPDRPPLVHTFRFTGSDFAAGASADVSLPPFSGSDDYCSMPLQTGTHWDGLAHAHHDGTLFNGYWMGCVTAFAGAERCSIHKLQNTLVGRGVLLDLPRATKTARIPPGHVITVSELERAASAQDVTIETGDILLVRTGHLGWYYSLPDPSAFWMSPSPGIGSEVVQWLYEREVAALAMDNVGVEVVPHEDPDSTYPLHSRLIRDLGLTIGELWALDELADVCAADGEYAFFICAPPLPFRGAAGSPVNPIVVK